MKLAIRLTLSIFLTLTLIGSTRAGQVSDNLQAKLTGADSDQLTPVWIQLATVNDQAVLKAAAGADATRAERYEATVQRLKRSHADQQQNLLVTLRQLESNGLVENINPHWLINMVEADVRAGAIAWLALHEDIVVIHAKPRITSIVPDKIEAAAPLSTSVSDHLRAINADDAWAAGYTGKGRLVCSFDTGVDGDHPALSTGWKGNDGDHAAAWYDPRYDGQSTPRDIIDCGYSRCNPNHGTHTMGTMIGHDADTVGVAPDAQWISAAVIDVTGTSIIDAFEWAADPDGDLNTIDDVPDVINHSWGVIGVGCENLFYNVIEATEALGIVNIFAAGNEGRGVYDSNTDTWSGETIRNPANRALDSIDCFAVGAVDATTGDPVIYIGSSRGPSDCNGAVKPNVTAPGVSIYSTLPDGRYGSSTGTSMAAPQVSGLVALMREKNPNATVEQIKTAILTTARNFGNDLPNNNFGWGVIDCMAAIYALPAGDSDPNVRLYSFDHAPFAPGDTVRGTIFLQNTGQDVSNVSIDLTSNEPLLTVVTGAADFGAINEGEINPSTGLLEVVVSEQALEGSVLSLDMQITGSGGYVEPAHLYFLVQPRLSRSIGTHDVGGIRFSLTNFGSFGLGDGHFFPIGGVGFTFDGSPDYMYEGGLVIGTDGSHVSDALRNSTGEPDGDFGVMPGGNISIASGPSNSQQITARFGDYRAENPLGINITQLSFAYPDYPNDDFIILKYALTNNNPTSLDGVYVGIYADWDVVNWQFNAGGFAAFDEFLWTAYHPDTSTWAEPRGMMVLEGPLATAWTHTGMIVSYDEDGFTETEKFDALTDGFSSGDLYKNFKEDLVQMIAIGPLDMFAGETDTVAFAMLAADDLNGMTAASDRARSAYDDLPTDVDDDGGPGSLPNGYALNQNYPNPFNPSTKISFVLPRKSEYRLSIYNVAGQKVSEIVGQGGIGANSFTWDARDFASGVYLYKLTAGDFSASRKMLLLR